jgi:hypothetical protein
MVVANLSMISFLTSEFIFLKKNQIITKITTSIKNRLINIEGEPDIQLFNQNIKNKTSTMMHIIYVVYILFFLIFSNSANFANIKS